MAEIKAYFVRHGGRVSGPFGPVKVTAMKAAGRLNEESELSEDQVIWVQVADVPWLTPPPLTVSSPEPPPVSSPVVSPRPPAEPFLRLVTEKKQDSILPPESSKIVFTPCESESETGVLDGAWRIASLLWNPTGALGAFYKLYGENGSIVASLFMFVLSTVVLLLWMAESADYPSVKLFCSGTLWLLMLKYSVAQWIMMFIFALIGRFVFSSDETRGGIGGDMLTSVLPLGYFAFIVLVFLFIWKMTQSFSISADSPKVIFLLVIPLIYASVFSILALYSGLTDIGKVKKSFSALLIVLMFVFNLYLIFYIFKPETFS